MPTYTQSNRYLQITTPLGTDALLLTGLRGHEGLSQLFSFQLDLLAEHATNVNFDQLLGRPATVELTLQGGQKRYFNGIVKRFRQGVQDDIFTHFHAELTPRFWLWTKRVRSRVFQQQSVPDILKLVLDGLDVSFSQLTGQYQPRNYCVQYRESDFAFASRLMEDEGIYYYFEHTANGHKMILADNSSRSPNLPYQAKLVFDQGEGGLRPEERIDRWDKSQEVCAGKYALWDHHFQLPGQYLAAEQNILAQVTAGQVRHSLRVGDNEKLELFDYPGGFSHRFDGIDGGGGEQQADLQKVFQDNGRTARLRMEEEASSGLWIEGGGTYRQMTPGYQFTLSRHFNGDGSYVLSRVEHEAAIHGDYSTTQETTLLYSNRFRCLPVDLPFRPPRTTPRPLVHGAQTATVIGPSQGSVQYTSQSNAAVGPSGDDIFCDRYGRVKVQFRWDRENEYGAGSSCWLRVNQPWAGQQWGAITLPRVGQEVIVSFMEGDPDRPLILGSVYNAAQMPPFPLPAAKTQAGIKAHSQGNGANAQTFSGLGFETALGEEHVHLHGERYMTHSAEVGLYQNIGEENHVNIGRVYTHQVGGLPGINHTFTRGKPTSAIDASSQSAALSSSFTTSPPPPPSGGPHGWNPSIAGTPSSLLGMNLGMTLGWLQTNTVGLRTNWTAGQLNTTTINPLAVPALFGAPIPLLGAVASMPGNILGMVLGPNLLTASVAANIGNSLSLQLGSALNVVRSGARITSSTTQTTAQTILSRLCAAFYTAICVFDTIMPIVVPFDYKTIEGTVEGMATAITALELAQSIWADVEITIELVTLLTKLTNATTTDAIVQVLQGNATCATLTAQQAAAAATAATEAIVAAKSPIKNPFGLFNAHRNDLPYHLLAPQIRLHSSPVQGAAVPLTPSIHIAANNPPTNTDGNVTIESGKKVHLSGGSAAYLDLTTTAPTDGTITLDCGTLGTIMLQSGITKDPNSILMNPGGMAIDSVVQVTVACGDIGIIVNPTGITLTAGSSLIEMTPTGISLECGPSAIQLTAAGITIAGPGVTTTADGSYSITSPLNQVD